MGVRSLGPQAGQAALRWWRPGAFGMGFIALWQAMVWIMEVPAWKLPAPWAIASELVVSRSLFIRHAWVTLQEVLLGFAVALVVGVALATLISSSPTFRRAI